MGRSAMDFGLVAGGLLKVALPKVAGAIATAVKDKLHLSELQRSLTVALQKSGAFERGQKANNAVFYRCTDKEADTFLIALLEHPEVQHELQKPLEQDGTLDVEILVQAARHVATTQNLAIATAPLEVWLKAFANAYFDAITAIRFQVAKADYLEQLANWFDDVKFAGVAVPGQDVERAERLAQIFVMPDVEEDGGVRSRVAFERSLFEEQGEQGRQGELLQEQRMRAQLERSGRKFSARQLLNQHQKKIVLLGAPGSGKTTLMSFFAVELAEKGAERQGAIAPTSDVHAEGLSPHTMALSGETKGLLAETKGLLAETKGLRPNTMALSGETIALSGDTEGLLGNTIELSGDTEGLLPILIRIRDWARTPDVTIPEYARQFAETTMSCKPLPKGFFEHWLNNGRALILLDGLDEVAEEAKRYHLVQCIENFLGQYPQNRAIITSRPAGYKRDFFRTEEFPHYELQPFDDGKIEEFCDRWYTSRVPDAAEAQRRKESLQKALNQQDRIKLLARNPLLLTIIALIHRYQARLPRERYKLYDKAVETLLTAWDDNKELSNQTVLQYLQLDDLRRLMESLAYWIHTQGNTGDREGGTLIDKDELIQKLCQEIKTLKQLQHYEAKAEADRFVKFIRDRTGLLNEQGQDCYAFVHKTFQEYLAAQDINYQADNEDDFEIVLTHIEQHLHDPHWREVLLLLIAQQSPKKAARAIRKVLSANSPYEQWLHRDLLFAARCLTEETKGLNEVDAKLVLTLLKELVELEGSHSKFAAEKLRKQVFQILCNLNTTVYQSQALDLLRTSAQKINKARLRRYQVVLGDAQAATALPLTLLQDKDSLVRSHASTELGNLGISSDVVVQGLLALLHDENSLVRSCAIAALSDLRNGSAAVERGLLALLKDDLPSVRSTAARVLGNLGIASDDVVQGLLTLLKDESSLVICSATEALGRLRNDSDAVVQELLASLKDANSEVRSNAAEELSNLGIASNAVVQGLLTLLKDAEPSVRSSAVGALDELGAVSDGVAQELLRLLKDNESSVRFSVAVALSKLGAASDDVVQGLLASLKDTSYGGRFSAAYALGELGNTSDAVMQGLLTSLKDANSEADSEVRARVAEAFGKLGNASNTVVQTLLALLQDKDSDVRARVVDALGELGTTSDAVVQGLLKSLRDKNSGVYYRSAEALGKLGIASDAVVQELLVVLQDENSHARSRVATVLGELAKRSNQVEPAIVQWIEQHQNEDCVGAGIDALWEIVEGEG